MMKGTWGGVASVVIFVVAIALAGSAVAAGKQSFRLTGLKDSPPEG